MFYGDGGKPEEGRNGPSSDYFARHPKALLVYADEDEIDSASGEPRRRNPWLKPDWSPGYADFLFLFLGTSLR